MKIIYKEKEYTRKEFTKLCIDAGGNYQSIKRYLSYAKATPLNDIVFYTELDHEKYKMKLKLIDKYMKKVENLIYEFMLFNGYWGIKDTTTLLRTSYYNSKPICYYDSHTLQNMVSIEIKKLVEEQRIYINEYYNMDYYKYINTKSLHDCNSKLRANGIYRYLGNFGIKNFKIIA